MKARDGMQLGTAGIKSSAPKRIREDVRSQVSRAPLPGVDGPNIKRPILESAPTPLALVNDIRLGRYVG